MKCATGAARPSFFGRYGDRQLNDKHTALACSFALDHHAAAVGFHNVANDRESQSETAVTACFRGIGLREPVENVRQEIRIDTLAGVRYGQLNAVICAVQADSDRAVFLREL